MSSIRRRDWWALLALATFVAFLHHRVVMFGEQPVGGDKTAFFYGLMVHYGECVQAGTLPFWNERWGFGFPGVAESQVGAFYFPHWILYRLLQPIDAFWWNYVLHHFAVAFSAYLSFRWMQLRPLGAWLAAMAYVGGGFNTVHFDHQWAVESMTWLPPIVAATYRWRTDGSRIAWFALPWLVGIQLTTGHFQVAFITLAIAGIVAIFPGLRRKIPQKPIRTWMNAVLGWTFSVFLGFCLAGPQVVTTFEFQRHIRSANPNVLNRDYLGNFALPPDRLVNLFWPMLYFREPLWREVMWDPFKTSPEECLNYIGLLPLMLAIASLRFFRRNAVVATGWTLTIVMTILAFGPYTPLFSLTSSLPGFGYFRSPARWTLGQEFALAWLAGWMLDRAKHKASSIRRVGAPPLVAWALLGIVLSFGWRHLAMTRSNPPVALSSLLAWLTPAGWQNPIEEIGRRLPEARNWSGMTARQWMFLDRPDRLQTLSAVFAETLFIEFLPTLVAGIASILVLATARRGRVTRTAAISLCLTIDLGIFGFCFIDRSTPRSRLLPEAELLLRLRAMSPNGRVIGPGGNFLMSTGLSPARSYRTLDMPWNSAFFGFLDAVESGNVQAISKLGDPPWSLFGIRATVGQYAVRNPKSPQNPVTFDDDQLDFWLAGDDRMRQTLAARVRRPNPQAGSNIPAPDPLDSFSNAKEIVGTSLSRNGTEKNSAFVADAHYVSNRGDVLWSQSMFPWQPATITPAFGGLYDSPPKIVGSVKKDAATFSNRSYEVTASEPGVLIVGELFLPGWQATITPRDGRSQSKSPGSCDAYWQAIELPGPGDYLVRFTYTPPGFAEGKILAAAGLSVWCCCLWAMRRRFNLAAF